MINVSQYKIIYVKQLNAKFRFFKIIFLIFFQVFKGLLRSTLVINFYKNPARMVYENENTDIERSVLIKTLCILIFLLQSKIQHFCK